MFISFIFPKISIKALNLITSIDLFSLIPPYWNSVLIVGFIIEVLQTPHLLVS